MVTPACSIHYFHILDRPKNPQHLKTSPLPKPFMTLTTEEKEFIKTLVEKELKDIEGHEAEFATIINNSPALSQLLGQDKDISFLASQEKYHQFLKELLTKL
jgi:hypothetical protein